MQIRSRPELLIRVLANREETMTRHRESKARELDRETRQTSTWGRIGFAIVVFAAIGALILLIFG